MTALTDALDTGVIPVGVGGKPADAGVGAYVVIWPDFPARSPSTMKLDSAYVETWVCHCYGRSADAAGVAAIALDRAIYSLHGATVDGRVVHYPELLSSRPLEIDRDADPPIYSYMLEWRLRTSPA